MPWSSQQLIKAVERAGFTQKKGKGRLPDGTLRSILRQLGMSEGDLRSLL